MKTAAKAGQELYLKTEGHWNREGHALAAKLIAGYLREHRFP